VELPKETADLVMKALEMAAAQVESQKEYEDTEDESSRAPRGIGGPSRFDEESGGFWSPL
jgi:hypothetical protein